MERILVIDDDASMCKTLAIGLSSDHCRVDTAGTGAEGLQAARRIDYDVTLVGLGLPDMNGVDVIRALRAFRPQAAVMIISARFTKESALDAIRLGACAYLEKPLEVERTRTRIQEALTRHRPAADRCAAEKNPGHTLATIVSELGHQLGNHLVAARGSAELAVLELSARGYDKVREHLNRILGACDKIDAIKKQILATGRLPVVRCEPVELTQLLAHCVDGFQGAVGLRSVSIRRDFPDAEVWIHGDRFSLEQAFNNLLHNALDAMTDRPERNLHIALSRHLSGAVVAIEDTGCGISASLIKKVFSRYMTTKPQGIGLGLHIVKRIITAHGGTIGIDSQPGQGTRFTIVLPTIAAPVPAAPHWQPRGRRCDPKEMATPGFSQ